jgi:hypothetical protein
VTITPHAPSGYVPHTIIFPTLDGPVTPLPPAKAVDGWTVVVMPKTFRPKQLLGFDRQMVTLMRCGYLRLVLEVNNLDWGDERCRALVENTWRRVRLRGGELRLVASTPVARRGLRTLRLPGDVQVFPTTASAIAPTR